METWIGSRPSNLRLRQLRLIEHGIFRRAIDLCRLGLVGAVREVGHTGVRAAHPHHLLLISLEIGLEIRD